jgi:hypothetical protein
VLKGENMKWKWLKAVLWTVGIVALILFVNLQLVLTLMYPQPFYYTNTPFALQKKVLLPSDNVVMIVSRCSNERTPVSVVSVKELYNPISGVIIPLPPGSGIIPPGCSSTETAFASVFPSDLPSGTYLLRGVTTFRGSLKTVDVSWQTQAFEFQGVK